MSNLAPQIPERQPDYPAKMGFFLEFFEKSGEQIDSACPLVWTIVSWFRKELPPFLFWPGILIFLAASTPIFCWFGILILITQGVELAVGGNFVKLGIALSLAGLASGMTGFFAWRDLRAVRRRLHLTVWSAYTPAQPPVPCLRVPWHPILLGLSVFAIFCALLGGQIWWRGYVREKERISNLREWGEKMDYARSHLGGGGSFSLNEWVVNTRDFKTGKPLEQGFTVHPGGHYFDSIEEVIEFIFPSQD